MNDFQKVREWANTWYNCYQVSLGDLKAYKKRLRELNMEKNSANIPEHIGKLIALKDLIYECE